MVRVREINAGWILQVRSHDIVLFFKIAASEGFLVGPTYHNFHPHAFSSSFSMLLSSSSRSCPH